MVAHASIALMRLTDFAPGAVFSFSFSSVSLADASVSRLASDDLNREGSRIDADDVRRCEVEDVDLPNAPGTPGRGVKDEGMRVGVAVDCVPVLTALRDTAGGGPIDPSTERFVMIAVGAEPLVRTLFAKAGLATERGGSLSLRSFTVLPASDNADGGLEPEIVGVAKIDDSRR